MVFHIHRTAFGQIRAIFAQTGYLTGYETLGHRFVGIERQNDGAVERSLHCPFHSGFGFVEIDVRYKGIVAFTIGEFGVAGDVGVVGLYFVLTVGIVVENESEVAVVHHQVTVAVGRFGSHERAGEEAAFVGVLCMGRDSRESVHSVRVGCGRGASLRCPFRLGSCGLAGHDVGGVGQNFVSFCEFGNLVVCLVAEGVGWF